VLLATALAACTTPSDSTESTAELLPTTSTTEAPAVTTVPAAPATFEVQPGVHQLAVLDAEPGEEIEVVGADGQVVATGVVDEQGSFLARELDEGTYTVRTTGPAPEAAEAVVVTGPDDVPPPSFYAEQRLPAPGFGYITTRDGTTLSANVVLPGPVEDGPYPTVVEYSGYSPSNPDDTTFAQLFTTLGYAYVGVNMRGTGCSGGSYRFFEEVQSLDGYDVIETVAAQPWVQGNRVGMVGVSYPGISQLFVAATRPPSLAAITPLSVLDDSYRSTLYPGGILNTGFAVEWTSERLGEAQPFGQEWTKARADAGDEQCAANQRLRLQNPDLVAEIRANPYYDPELGDPLAPATFVDQIEVPVFLAGAWQDEQTGGRFPVMLDDFSSTPHFYATLVNGLHTESVSPSVFPRFVEFLDLYVAKRTPSLDAARLVAPVLTAGIFGVPTPLPEEDRFAGLSHEQALAAFEAEPPIQVLFEQGAADGTVPGTPLARFSVSFDAWPVPGARAIAWYLGVGGTLTSEAPTTSDSTSTYTADPTALPATFYEGSSSGIWRADVVYDWRPVPAGTGLTFTSEPLAADTVVIGSGSADLWISSSSGDTDLEVTVSEVRPDGSEVYVQSGWLRASQRALDEEASTELRPVHTHREADAALLPAGELTPVRVEIFPFAHPFRAGSRLRVTIDAPGNSRGVWELETVSDGETVTIGHSADAPSRLVLSVVPGIAVPPGVPACGALRGQPCRPAP
jgi:predicted acyl esterase